MRNHGQCKAKPRAAAKVHDAASYQCSPRRDRTEGTPVQTAKALEVPREGKEKLALDLGVRYIIPKRKLGKIAIQCSFGVNIFASATLSAGMFDIFEH